jgi:hypothetical protein
VFLKKIEMNKIIEEDYVPKEITLCSETKRQTASFSYYDGLCVAKILGLRQCVNINQIYNDKFFIVCCGEVMISVSNEDYKNIKRREF